MLSDHSDPMRLKEFIDLPLAIFLRTCILSLTMTLTIQSCSNEANNQAKVLDGTVVVCNNRDCGQVIACDLVLKRAATASRGLTLGDVIRPLGDWADTQDRIISLAAKELGPLEGSDIDRVRATLVDSLIIVTGTLCPPCDSVYREFGLSLDAPRGRSSFASTNQKTESELIEAFRENLISRLGKVPATESGETCLRWASHEMVSQLVDSGKSVPVVSDIGLDFYTNCVTPLGVADMSKLQRGTPQIDGSYESGELSPADNGFRWAAASYSDKLDLCSRLHRANPGHSSNYYLDFLNDVFDGSEPNMMSETIAFVLALGDAMTE